jgi:hypothetical protein
MKRASSKGAGGSKGRRVGSKGRPGADGNRAGDRGAEVERVAVAERQAERVDDFELALGRMLATGLAMARRPALAEFLSGPAAATPEHVDRLRRDLKLVAGPLAPELALEAERALVAPGPAIQSDPAARSPPRPAPPPPPPPTSHPHSPAHPPHLPPGGPFDVMGRRVLAANSEALGGEVSAILAEVPPGPHEPPASSPASSPT